MYLLRLGVDQPRVRFAAHVVLERADELLLVVATTAKAESIPLLSSAFIASSDGVI